MSDNAPAVTLADLRRLLEGGLERGGPAIDREPEDNRSVRGLAAVYLGDDIASMLCADPVVGEARWAVAPRRNHALLVALALHLGLDPGEGTLGVMWYPSAEGWCLGFLGSDHCYKSAVFHGILGLDRFQDWHYAPTVAAEPNPVRALALAVAHVLA